MRIHLPMRDAHHLHIPHMSELCAYICSPHVGSAHISQRHGQPYSMSATWLVNLHHPHHICTVWFGLVSLSYQLGNTKIGLELQRQLKRVYI